MIAMPLNMSAATGFPTTAWFREELSLRLWIFVFCRNLQGTKRAYGLLIFAKESDRTIPAFTSEWKTPHLTSLASVVTFALVFDIAQLSERTSRTSLGKPKPSPHPPEFLGYVVRYWNCCNPIGRYITNTHTFTSNQTCDTPLCRGSIWSRTKSFLHAKLKLKLKSELRLSPPRDAIVNRCLGVFMRSTFTSFMNVCDVRWISVSGHP